MIDIKIKHPAIQYTQEEVEEILAQYNRTLNNVQVDVDAITKWMKTQPHLIHVLDERIIFLMLVINKFSIEKTKKIVDYYYTVRGLLPIAFTNYVPSNKEIISMRDICQTFALPKLINLNRVLFFVISTVTEKFDCFVLMKKGIMDVESLVYQDISNSLEIVLDYSATNLNFWCSVNVTAAKIILQISEKVYAHRVKAVRIIGLPSVAQTLISYCITLAPKKIQERMFFHKSGTEMADVYPIDELPVEYGGKAKSYKEFCKDFNNMVDQCEDYFQHIHQIKIDEKLRPAPLNNDEILGFHGNFRKLELD